MKNYNVHNNPEKSINIGLGTAAIGRPLYINLKNETDTGVFSLPKFKEKGIQVLEKAYAQGIRFFDTAPGYGLAENLLIEWVHKKSDPNIAVSTKWGYTYTANFDPHAKQHEVKEHSIDKLNEQWERSKKLLPNLKIYQIHSATLDTGVLANNKILKRLHELKKENDLIIGLTTTGATQTEVLENALSVEIENEPLFQSFQCTFNILDQSVVKYKGALQERSGPFLIKEALANGRLIPNNDYGAYQELYDVMLRLGKRYGVGADAVALRFGMEIFPNAMVLSGANNGDHVSANLKATGFSLTGPEIEELGKFGVSADTYWQERKQLAWN